MSSVDVQPDEIPEATPDTIQNVVTPGTQTPLIRQTGDASSPKSDELVFVWEGIGVLHQSYFTDSTAVDNLELGLSAFSPGSELLIVRYSTEERIGELMLELTTGVLPANPNQVSNTIDLNGLVKVTKPLAAYRSEIAARFDYRIESFKIGVTFRNAGHVCSIGVSGPAPPDGSEVSPCVTVDGVRSCGDTSEQGFVFTPEVANTLRLCVVVGSS